ncbi:MAG TPA: DUF2330 domain-containing protein, partial [bacterium]|nr:DUF2330 domain-containing protein [bacterium]
MGEAGLTAFLAVSTQVLADGFHVSAAGRHLTEPTQKAVLAWDGTIERLSLASAVTTDDLDDIAWIIPLPSSTPPKAAAGSIELFRELAEAVYEPTFP